MKRGKILGMAEPGNFWAIEIGDDHVCAARLLKDLPGHYRLRDLYWQDLESDPAMAETSTVAGGLVSALNKLLQRAEIKNSDVVFSVSARQALTLVQFLPSKEIKIGEKELARYALSRSLALDLENCLWDYCFIAGKATECRPYPEHHLLLAALTWSNADFFIEVLKRYDCRIHGISIDSLNAYNWLKHTGQLDDVPVRLIIAEKEAVKIVYQGVNCGCSQDDGIVSAVESFPVERKDLYDFIKKNKFGTRVVLTGYVGHDLVSDSGRIREICKIATVADDSFLTASLVGSGRQGDLALSYDRLAPVLGLALSCHHKTAVEMNLLSQL